MKPDIKCSSNPKLQAALAQTRKGRKVIPLHSCDDGICSCNKSDCRSKGKHPYTTNGIKDASDDEVWVRDQWRKHPNANIGVATGSGTEALDVDMKKGVNGIASLKKLESKYGALPETEIVTTPTGGHHQYFHSGDILLKNKVGFQDGLDFRSKGGYVVAAGSSIDGKFYTVQNSNICAAPIPEWLVSEVLAKKKKSRSCNALRQVSNSSGGFPEGQRNDSLFKAACNLISKDISYDKAKILILKAAADCSPPLDDNEALACLDSAYDRYTPSAPNFSFTEYGNAERFVEQYGNNVRYIPEYNCWIVRDDQKWIASKHGEIERLAKKTMRRIIEQEADTNNLDTLDQAIKFAKRSETAAALKNMMELVKSENGMSISASDLDSDDYLFGVKNGVVDLRTGKLIDGALNDYITKTSNVEFDPAASCEKWAAFICQITGGKKTLIKYLQRYVGYLLIGGNPEQIFSFIYGHGANGKSTFLSILNFMLGGYGKTVEPSMFMVNKFHNSGGPREDIMRLKGARCVMTSEGSEGQVLDEEMVKRMTGDDIMTARMPYAKHTIEFRPKFTPIMITNHQPIIKGEDHAIWRRIRLIPFMETFEGKNIDKNLVTKLLQESSGILNWALKGSREYIRYGLPTPINIQKATETYRTEMDLLAEWIEVKCIIVPNGKETSKNLYANFQTYHQGDTLCQSISSRHFGRKLSSRGLVNAKVNGERGWKGISLKTPEYRRS